MPSSGSIPALNVLVWRVIFLVLALVIYYAGAGLLDGAAAASLVGTCPATSASVLPGSSIQMVVDAAPVGATICIRAGVYRLQTIQPKDDQTLVGEPGAILNGSQLLSGWISDGSRWRIGGQTQQFASAGTCQTTRPGCAFPEQLFIDDVALEHVLSVDQVNATSWWFDDATDTIWIGRDPGGHTVETSVTPFAITGIGARVTVSGLIIEKYATSAQQGAVTDVNSSTGNWIVTGNEIRLNHGIGVMSANPITISNNYIHDNGQLGISGYQANGAIVDGNEVSYNNTAGFDYSWEAGGMKFSATADLSITNNNVHHNMGNGMWTDGDNIRTLYEGNRAEANWNDGIFHEISYSAIIRNNVLIGNGTVEHRGVSGAGILIDDSPDVQVYGNHVEGNYNSITARQNHRSGGLYGPHETANLDVHDNEIIMDRGATGMIQDVADQRYFTSRNNLYHHNTYQLSGTAFYRWMDTTGSKLEWQGWGQDLDGTWLTTTPTTSIPTTLRALKAGGASATAVARRLNMGS
jgi:hypothetical protein